jgi:hypothetical protein
LTETERGFPLLEGLVVLVCGRVSDVRGEATLSCKHTQVLVLVDRLLLANHEALGLLRVQVVVVVGHFRVWLMYG